MSDKDRNEEKLDEIRRRVRLAEEREKRGEPEPDSERGPAVSTWHPAEGDRPRERKATPREAEDRPREPRYPGAPTYPMDLGYAPMMGGYPGYPGYPTPVGMPFEGHWTPRAEAFERGGHRIFRLELPGVDKHDAEVRIEGNRLIVEGERRRDEESDREELRSEWPYGRFYRAFSLPYPVDPSDVKARYRDGVLDIAVPQPTREERRRAIKVEG